MSRGLLRAAGLLAAVVAGGAAIRATLQSPAAPTLSESALRQFAGTYEWAPGSVVDLDLWSELTGSTQLTAIDQSGEIRTFFPTAADAFSTGPAAAVAAPVESRIEFQRDPAGAVAALTWHRAAGTRTARRVTLERQEEVHFSNGPVRLAGTLTMPLGSRRHPAIVLVHGSGAASRDQVFPLARFLTREGVALLAYDKRGVGGSSGDWNSASFDDLAGDVVAAVEFLKTRTDVDPARIGLFGWSQAGWVMPLAAAGRKDIAFLISLSGAAVPPAETTLDQSANELTARGMKPQTVEQIVNLMKLQYAFAGSGQGWDEYSSARAALAARMGTPPPNFPAARDDPHWTVIRRVYLYDPGPALRRLRTPVLALFGELDNNILAEKNRAAWDIALRAAGNQDFTLRILSKANHGYLEASLGSNAETASLRRFVPDYRTTIVTWLGPRLKPAVSPR